MNILAIDIGTYSIKFIEVRPERKYYTLLLKQEIVIDEARSQYPDTDKLHELQREIVNDYIQRKHHDIKIIFQIPNEMFTTRYLEIPGTSKRKAELVIPFQLEENLPFPVSHAHFSSRLSKKSNAFSVLSNIVQLNEFKNFFSQYENKDCQPSILTSEISIIQNYIEYIKMNESCCILDLGHTTSKAYFVQNRQIVSNHISYIAGASINEVISKTYQITAEDAIIYKHENAFLLSDNQLDEVSPEQKNFALLMKQVLNPLILNLKRWIIGHRVKYSTSVDKIYLIGGTSNINNIENFIHYHTGIRVDTLPSAMDLKEDYTPHDKKFYIAKLMALTMRSPSGIINFLIGKFQSASSVFISPHSAVFIWVRSTFIFLLILIGLIGERYLFLAPQNKIHDVKIKGILKRSNLNFSTKERNSYNSDPKKILNLLKKKNKFITDEVRNILSATDTNPIFPLVQISKTIGNSYASELIQFKSDGYISKAVFTAANKDELSKLTSDLQASGLGKLNIENSDTNKLIVTFEVK